jgi:hypothetical protein
VLVALLANDALYAAPALGVIGLSAGASVARARRRRASVQGAAA